MAGRAGAAWVTLAFAALAACGERPAASGDAARAEEQMALMDGLGDLHHAITTRAPRAQQFFDQGLRLDYAFNHAEAIRSFRAAQSLNAECAMCFWGEALAWGPNINLPMDSASAAAAFTAITRAKQLAGSASEKERAYINALAWRYSPVPAADRAALDTAYARAMHDLTQRYPEDDDAAVLWAESEMDLSPWDYWVDNQHAKPNMQAAIAALETIMARSPDHPGACHFYIHAVEKTQPEKAVPCAEKLPSLMPAAGHIVHMPAHVYIRVGRYAEAVERNVHATHADEAIMKDMAPDGIYRVGYYPHNYHFLAFAAGMAGMSEQAISAAQHTTQAVDTSLMRRPEMTTLQQYRAVPYWMLVRFGRWQDVLAQPAPAADLAYVGALYHYARAVALARTGRVPDAEAELRQLRTAKADSSIRGVRVWGINEMNALLEIADNVAAGEIAAARKDTPEAIARLRVAVQQEDALTYDEPPTWMNPVRPDLGAVLLAAGRAADAEKVYREDLDKFAENGWSLFGLAQALEAQGKKAEAAAVRERFTKAWSKSDVTLTSSRF